MLAQLKKDLLALKNPPKAKILARFFKTGPGQYGEGDQFLGITVPQQRQLAKKYLTLKLEDLENLLDSPIHEFRFTALEILVMQYEAGDSQAKKKIVKFYLNHLDQVNNWDLVDTSAPYILGDYLRDKDRGILYKLVKSPNIWHRRVAILSSFTFIKNHQFTDTLRLAEILLSDQHDLIHKAVGWMLREVGKLDEPTLFKFLDKHSRHMPRTALRYAVEKLDQTIRQQYLHAPRQ